MFRVIVADPAWTFTDQGSRATPTYHLMSTDEICVLEVGELAYPDALLALWVPSALIADGLRVVRAWGFVEKQTVVWVKTKLKCKMPSPMDTPASFAPAIVNIGMGKYTRNAHEIAILAARGKASQHIKDHSIPSVFFAPRTKHSAKPEVFQDMLERLIDGPFLELFARRMRPGWTTLGDELPDGGGYTPLENMYDCTPCPRCRSVYRWPSRDVHPATPNAVICDECGLIESNKASSSATRFMQLLIG